MSKAYVEILTASNDVGLTDEAGVLIGRAVSVANSLDQRYRIIPKVQTAAVFIISKLTTAFSRYSTFTIKKYIFES